MYKIVNIILLALIEKTKERVKELNLKIQLKRGNYLHYKVTSLDNIGVKIDVFKEKTIEPISLLPIFQFIKSGQFNIEYPEIGIWKMQDAISFHKSDFILVDGKMAWQKFFSYNYTKNISTDFFKVACDKDDLYIHQFKITHIVNVAYSLIGVHAHIWSHALSEYLIKAFALDIVLKDANSTVTVLVPDYLDAQLKELMYGELSKFGDKIDILIVNEGDTVLAKTLYFMERPARFTDHEMYVEIGDSVQPKITADILQEKLVKPYWDKYIINNEKSLKLYLPRSKKTARSMLNNEEVESFFRQQGFYFLEPHTVSLEEKIRLFFQADIIVGPFSSSFSNLIFCKPGTKCLIFFNYQRAFESWLSMHYQHFKINILGVIGEDVHSFNMSHANYRISLAKIKSALKSLNIAIDE